MNPESVACRESDLAISVADVYKTYRLYPSHQDRLKEALHPFRKRYHREFSALSGISFDIRKGESVGILGRNGAGKSTLLQLIAGVLTPTSGTISVNGRVAALLELGAGFNPDLTGRENVILASTIQGVAEDAIPDRVAAIEEFADVGVFFDQPMKIYSSGMYARVAFANAINVNPDILIVDEILGVGDAKFQEKCYSKIRSLREQGVCILFVSHSTEVVQRNCESAILLESGNVVKYGPADAVIAIYHDLLYGSGATLKNNGKNSESHNKIASASSFLTGNLPGSELVNFLQNGAEPWYQRSGLYNPNERRFGNGDAEIVDFFVTADGHANFDVLSGNESLAIYIKVKFNKYIAQPEIGWAVVSPEGIVLSGSNTAMTKVTLPQTVSGEIRAYEIKLQPTLCGGDFFLNLGVGERVGKTWTFLDNRRAIIHLTVAHQESASGFFNIPFKCKPISDSIQHE